MAKFIREYNITNNSNDKRFLKYLKTTIDDKIHNNSNINILNSHEDIEIVDEKNDKTYSDLKNFISNENNNKSANKINNFSYKKDKTVILGSKNNTKEYNSL